MPRKASLKTLRKKAERAYSDYIRHRDATFELQDNEGFSKPAGRCITCSKASIINDGTMNCGHFIPQGSCALLKFNEYNSNLQCVRCNYNQGEQYKHGKAIVNKWGSEILEKLQEKEAEYKKMKSLRWNKTELRAIIQFYKDKLKALDTGEEVEVPEEIEEYVTL